MLQLRATFVLATVACAMATVSSGCSAPMASPLAATAVDRAENVPPQVAQKPPADDESNLAGVFDKLQQIGEIDPAAEQKLMEELKRTPSESWPLVAEQFRASLAYREQLKTSSALPTSATTAAAGATVAGIGGLPPAQGLPVHDTLPSMPIGTLVEPRLNEKDEAATVVQQAPRIIQAKLAEAAPPADFASEGQTQQLKGDDAAGAVVQAKLETSAQPPSSDAPSTPGADDADWQQLVKRATEDLGSRVSPSPTTTAEVHQHVSLRMLRLLAGDTEKALEPIPHIGPVEQDYWSRQLFALATYLDHHTQPDDKRRAAASVVHLDESVAHLRELGSLTLRNLTFCKAVYGYGAIEAYESDHFSPGQRVSLYVEIENYHSQSTEKGFHTQLGSSYEILNKAGERVGGEEFPDVDDYCRSRRRDFHLQLGIVLPEQLAAETHRLRVIVKDRQSEKIAQSESAFEVGGAKP